MALLTSGPLSEALHLSEDGVDVLDGTGVGAGEDVEVGAGVGVLVNAGVGIKVVGPNVEGVRVLGVAELQQRTSVVTLRSAVSYQRQI